MDSKFIPTLQVGNGYTHLKLRGVLDEDNLLSNLLSQIQGRLLLIDLSELERINSCGVRDWVNWLNQIQMQGFQVILLRCSPAAVAQANMVTNFAGDAFIHSFFAPYVNADSGDEQSVLFCTEDLRNSSKIPPQVFDDKGDELEFDEFEGYFAFLKDPRIVNYQMPEDIKAVVQYFVPEAASHKPVINSKSGNNSGSDAPAPAVIPQTGPAAMPMAPGAMNFGAQNFGMNPPAAPAFSAGPGFAAPQPPAAPAAPASPVLPTPAAPVRHEQPPLPTNAGYQQLPQTPAAPAPAPAPASTPAPAPAPAPVAPAAPAPVAPATTPAVDNASGNISKNDMKNLMKIAVVVLVVLVILLIAVVVIKSKG